MGKYSNVTTIMSQEEYKMVIIKQILHHKNNYTNEKK